MNNQLIENLKSVLADSYALYLKTQNYHWNVEGANFVSLHGLFEAQYTNLADAIDTAAELIRSLGAKTPASFAEYSRRTIIKPGNEEYDANQMVKDLATDQTLIEQTLQETLKTANQTHDDVVADFIIERLTAHRKTKWMLNSLLQ